MRDVTASWTGLATYIRDRGARIVGIAGAPGAGKSTFAVEVAGDLGDALVVSTDDYYLSKAERRERGMRWRGPPGSHDVSSLVDLLDRVRARQAPITVQRFSSNLDDRLDADAYPVVPEHLLLDGLILGYRGGGYDKILDRLDLLAFLDVDVEAAKAQRFAREARLREHGGGFTADEMQHFWDEVLQPSIDTWVGDAKRAADVVIELDDRHNVRSVRVRD